MKCADKSYYNTVLSTVFSPCGNYFLTGNIYGDVAFFKLNRLLNHEDDIFDENLFKISKNKFILSLSEKYQITSLISTEHFLIAGIGNEIVGWSWSNIINLESTNFPKSSWNIRIPPTNDNADASPEVNSLKICPKADSNTVGDVLYAGCGDNKIHSFSLEDGRFLRTFTGHTDYVHNIDLKDNLLVSGSEDGSVRIWDSRVADVLNVIEPYRSKEVNRPKLGKWIGDVSLNDDWLLCGGGVRLSLWNLRSMDIPMTVFSKTQDNGIYVSKFVQDGILAGGSAQYFSLLSYNDELQTEIQSSNSTVYSCAVFFQQNLPKALGLVGNSNYIDISTNCKFRDYVLPFY